MKRSLTGLKILLVVYSVLFSIWGCGEKSSEDLYKKAMALYEAGKYAKAVKVFELLLAQYPEHSLARKVRYQLGEIYFYKLNQPPIALKYLQELYAQSPQGKYSMNALQLIGAIDESLNKYADAIEVYRKLLREYAAEIEAAKYQLAIAEGYFKFNNYQQAIAEYETLIKQYPNSPYVARANFQIANSYALTEAYDKAIEHYEALLQAGSVSEQLAADIKLELAYCYGQKEQFPKALDLYEGLLKVNAKDVSLDKELILKKREQILKRLEESAREPGEVQWKREKR